MKNQRENKGGKRNPQKYQDKKNKYTELKNEDKSNKQSKINKQKINVPKFGDKIRLNKYIANAGICSRREADELIKSGVVSVNDKIVTELGFKIESTDIVKFDGLTIKSEVKRYVLFNKPVGFSIRYEDSPQKKTAYQLLKKSCKEQLSPVGKMNKDDCGLILYTNDGDLLKKMTHPKALISQIFHVVLDREITAEDLKKLTLGMFVDNKMFSVKEANFIKQKPHNEIGVHFLSSKSNMIKYMLGKLGYKIEKLDRVDYAGLTKKDLPRGFFRHLQDREIGFLKMS